MQKRVLIVLLLLLLAGVVQAHDFNYWHPYYYRMAITSQYSAGWVDAWSNRVSDTWTFYTNFAPGITNVMAHTSEWHSAYTWITNFQSVYYPEPGVFSNVSHLYATNIFVTNLTVRGQQDLFGPLYAHGNFSTNWGHIFVTNITIDLAPTLPNHGARWVDLTNEVTQATNALGGGGMTYVDRGDPAAWDWTAATLTEDGTWRDLDCSAIVPADAIAIVFYVEINCTQASKTLSLRENGNANAYNIGRVRTQAANRSAHQQMMIFCDSDRKVEYNAASPAPGTWNTVGIVVIGWFI